MSVPMVAPDETHRATSRRQRAAAHLGLRLALAAERLPLRLRLRIADACGHLPTAEHAHVDAVYGAVLTARGTHTRRTACWEIAFGTQLACALTGHGTTLVLGVRPLPWSAHAWILTPHATLGITTEDTERPWLPLRYAPARNTPI